MVIMDGSNNGSGNIDDVYNRGSNIDGCDGGGGSMVAIPVTVVGGGGYKWKRW